jgi:hypothetical protein
MILMDALRRVMTNVPPGVKEGFGPANASHHPRTFPYDTPGAASDLST